MKDMRYCPQCGTELESRTIDDKPRKACPDESCGYVFWNNPTPIVAAIVEHEQDIILVQNKGWPSTWFGLVSGFLEAGESPEEGMLREVKEEVGLEGEITSFVGLYPFAKMNQLIVAYHVRATGTVELGDELESVKRVPVEKLKPWPFGTGLAVRDWLAAR